MNFRFRAFRAVNDLNACLMYREGHRDVLKDYGITNVTTNNDAWMYNPDIYCVVAESSGDMKIVGGVRIQISRVRGLLPVELAIGKMDEKIFDAVENFRATGGVAELCALWNAKTVAGSGLSKLLIRAGIVSSGFLPVKTLMTICADYTLKMFESAGFREVKLLHRAEGYPYPNRSYAARVLAICDLVELKNADSADRERMQSLQSAPSQTYVEEEQGHKSEIAYGLLITNN